MGLEKFSAALDVLKGFHVNLYVGENVYKGKLIGVEKDHVVLETDNNYIFYYNIEKIQAITKNTKQFQPDVSDVKFQKTQSLKELLHSFQNTWVTILAFNKQKFTGVLSEIDEDFVTVINGEERILIKVEHVSNILKGALKEDDTKQENNKDTNKDTKKETNKDIKKDTKKNSNESQKNEKDNKKEKNNNDCLTFQETENKSKQKSKSSSNNDADKKEKTDEKIHEVVATEEKVVWSQPIKCESVVTPVKEGTNKSKKSHSEEKTPKMAVEPKKSPNEPAIIEKNEESNKHHNTELLKEKKHEKEVAPLFKMEPAPLLQMPKKEVKPVKSKETSTPKPNMSHNTSNKKPEHSTSEMNTNDTKSVWKQRDKETQAFRFAGEPVRRDEIKAFPFAGWPNRSKRTFRF